ncbi:uncharacterized protein LOC121381228 isoform X2 [Gigantopelta aegis]|uniref:uncharacterized protein LOC121381228 isoform X2 n=1 Tax=Gigantopelta aegis TaxID=1735272 RepID=UPI001B888F63|nr:uncharacterized protein LOC121381228 isoform X2 [Gigantopelta aegis]
MYESAREDGVPFSFESMEKHGNSPETAESDDLDRTTHKRKLDKDGFVHPTTPDIPKTSMQYSLPSFQIGIGDLDFGSAKAIREEGKENDNCQDVDDGESPHDRNFNTSNKNQNKSSDHSIQLCDFATIGKSGQTVYLAEQNIKHGNYVNDNSTAQSDYVHLQGYSKDQSAKTSECSAHKDFTFSKEDESEKRSTSEPEDKGRKQHSEPGPLTTMEDLFKELSQEAKMVTMQFSSDFVQSENYETFCMTRLDQLISHAQDLEQAYIKQKEVLRQRLRVISHTLQNM